MASILEVTGFNISRNHEYYTGINYRRSGKRSFATTHFARSRNSGSRNCRRVDIVQVALLQTIDDDNHPLAGIDQSQVSALDRLGMRDGIEEISMIGGVIEVEKIRDAIL